MTKAMPSTATKITSVKHGLILLRNYTAMVSIKRIIDKCFIIFCNNSYAYHFHLKAATSYTLERKYV